MSDRHLDPHMPVHPYSAAIEAGAKVLRQFRDTNLDFYTDKEIVWLVYCTMQSHAPGALAAGTQRAETACPAQSEGCQSGPNEDSGNAQNSPDQLS